MAAIPEKIMKECQFRTWEDETSVYGSVLPGDEEGFYCDLSGSMCNEVPDFRECFRFVALDDPCPADIGNGDEYEPCGEMLYRDTETGDIYCEECGEAEV